MDHADLQPCTKDIFPKGDVGCRAAVNRTEKACRLLATVYQKLEEAYIAYKKMQATPGRKEYAEMMRSALEDGVQEAETTAARYREMSKMK